MNRASRKLAAGAALWLGLATAAQAVPSTFTSRAAFDAFLAANSLVASTVDFESTPAGTPVPDGTAFGNVTLTYNRGALSAGLDMIVTNQFVTTSGTNYLGVDDGFEEFFFNDDGLTLAFGTPVNAVGLFIIAAEDANLPDDYVLTAAGTSLGNGARDFQLATGNSAIPFDDVYFLGIIDPDATFLSAALTSLDPAIAGFAFNVDDIVTARQRQNNVPAPGTLALMGLGLAALGVRRRKS